VASLQECEAIVYYLYQHQDVLEHFLRAFETWKDRVLRNQRCFQTINDLHQQITAGEGTDEGKKRFSEACAVYAHADITCPFILDGACSIYEVRPYVCAGVVATTPRDWCAFGHPRHSEAVFYKVSVKTAGDMPYFALPKTGEIISSMPSLVHDILLGGYSTLSTIPGLSNLRREALNDSDVQAILANLKL
jgi:hypothetical protein